MLVSEILEEAESWRKLLAMATLDEFLLYARFKGELPPEWEDYKPPHWGLLARAMHALGDTEEKSEATSWLTEEGIEPDDKFIHRLLGKWREQLFGARTISVGGRGRRPKDEMDYIRFHLYLLTAQENPATVRSIYYRAVSRGLVPKTESGYRTVQQQLLGMRRNRLLPWS